MELEKSDFMSEGVLSKNKMIVVVVLFLFGIFGSAIFGYGITGKVIYGENVRALCVNGSECGAQVCCLFYEEEAGVCHSQEYCQIVEEITKNEKNKTKALEKIGDEIPSENNYLFSIIVGALITVGVGISLYFIGKKNSEKA